MTMDKFQNDQLRRQRRSYLKSIVGLETVNELSPSQEKTLVRYRDQVARIETILTENGEPLET